MNEVMRIQNISIKMIDIQQYHETGFSNENFKSLRESIKEEGLINPITVRLKADGRYQLINGFHRLKACRTLGWKEIPANIQQKTFVDEISAYVSDRQNNIHENLKRQHYSIVQQTKQANELNNLFYLQNPEAKVMRGEIERVRKEAEKALKEVMRNLEDPELFEDNDFYQEELQRLKGVLEKTKTPLQRLVERGFSEQKAKEILFLTELSNDCNPEIPHWIEQSSKLSEYKIYRLKKLISLEENLKQLKKIKNKEDFAAFVAGLEGRKNSNSKQKTEIFEEVYGVAKIGRKHFLIISDFEHTVNDESFNTRIYVKDFDVANSTIKVLSLAHLKVLAVCETEEAYDYVLKSFKF